MAHLVADALELFADHPKYVVDVGCGTGQMLARFGDFPEVRLLGIESPHGITVFRDMGIFELTTDQTIAFDLRHVGEVDMSIWAREPDLLARSEVLEHLPDDAAIAAVQAICMDVKPKWIAVSGAREGQGGTGHINEHSPSTGKPWSRVSVRIPWTRIAPIV